MAKIVDTRNTIDQTIRIFDSFYGVTLTVNPNEYDIVHGYFLSVCDTKAIANNFTAALFRISQETGIPVLELLGFLQGTNNKLEMNKTICYFLNTLKTKTALYGVSQIPTPNQPVARNILQ